MTVVSCIACLYAIMSLVGAARVYLHTDYDKVDASVCVKVEVTLLLGMLWPFVLLYIIKQTMKEKRNGKEGKTR